MYASATYGNLHPNGRFGVFSTNLVIPEFHTLAEKKLEVYDRASDLIVIDFENNRIITSDAVSGEGYLETFPAFSANGNRIYFCRAKNMVLPDSIEKLQYLLCKIDFDQSSGSFGNKIDTVFLAQDSLKSISFPKPSPDGHFLMYAVSDYGTFPIWHRETDLHLLDLETGEISEMQNVNSDRSDTYHSWSSNSRWFVFASKRDDGLYGKPYFCYLDNANRLHKPFVLPQRDPFFYDYTLKSFNIPELSTGQMPYGAREIERIYWNEHAENMN